MIMSIVNKASYLSLNGAHCGLNSHCLKLKVNTFFNITRQLSRKVRPALVAQI